MMFKLVDTMEQSPSHCVVCRGRPANHDGELPSVLAPGVDVNFGEALYICAECGPIIGKLFGLVDKETHKELRETHRVALRDLHALENEAAELKEKLDRIRDGNAALRSVRKSKSSKRRAAA